MKNFLFLLLMLVFSIDISSQVLTENTFSQGVKQYNTTYENNSITCKKTVQIRAYNFTSLNKKRFRISVTGLTGVRKLIPGKNPIRINDKIYDKIQEGDVFLTEPLEFKSYNSLYINVLSMSYEADNSGRKRWVNDWSKSFYIEKCSSKSNFKQVHFRFVTHNVDDIISKCSDVVLPTANKDLSYMLYIPKNIEITKGSIYKLYLNKSGRGSYYKVVTGIGNYFETEGYFYTRALGDAIAEKSADCENPPSPNPPTTSGKPNLVIDKTNTAVYSQCLTCPPPLDAFIKSKKKLLVSNGSSGSITFKNLVIKNIGKGIPNKFKTAFYLSTNKTLEDSDKLITTKSYNNFLLANESTSFELDLSGRDIFGEDARSPVTNGNYYLLIKVDSTNKTDEGAGESDNLLAIPFTFTTNNISSKQLSFKPNNSADPYQLTILNLSGELVKEQMVLDKNEEERVINNIDKKGLYIVKSGLDTYKVMK